jgi:hypothetical protein
MSKKVTIAYHGHCFDGMSSAAVLTRFFRARMGESTEFTYRGLDHQPGGSFVPNAVLDGEENAVVDFRYTTSPALTWFFDHHKSGIVGEEEQRHFDADTSGQKFFDPTYGSCCKLIVDITKSKFAHEAPELADLVDWADLIDAARFPTPSMPVELKEPALKMMTVVEVHGSDKFLAPRIEKLSRGVTLAEIASEKKFRTSLRLFSPCTRKHSRKSKPEPGAKAVSSHSIWWASAVTATTSSFRIGSFLIHVIAWRLPPANRAPKCPWDPIRGRKFRAPTTSQRSARSTAEAAIPWLAP